MPTIQQLPAASRVNPADKIPLSQDGVTRSATVGTLLATTQPAIQTATGTLLGRTSLGTGGPEPVTVGAGLSITNANLTANGADHAGFTPQTTLQPTDEVVLNSRGTPARMMLSLLRGLFSAGTNIAIDPTGVISSSAGSTNITGLSPVTSIAANDLIGVSQGGADHSITYTNFLNGQTIDLAQPAISASDSDSFWVSQGSTTMLRQNFATIWNWVTTKLPGYKWPVVELTTNTTLDGTVHNGRLLVCSSPLTLTPTFINMGSGFHCEVVNLSSGTVTLGAGIVTSTGGTTLPSGQSTNLRAFTYSAGNTIFATMPGSSSTLTVPGQVTGLVANATTSSSITISWAAPTSGGSPTAYTVQYKAGTATAWTTASNTITGTSLVLTGLAASTAYNIQILATNSAGTGANSLVLTANTAAAALVTSITWNLAPSGPYVHGSGSIGINAHVTPSSAAVQFGFSTSATVPPVSWVAGSFVTSDIWAAYVNTPATAGTWYAWAQGTDGSASTVYPTGFTVT